MYIALLPGLAVVATMPIHRDRKLMAIRVAGQEWVLHAPPAVLICAVIVLVMITFVAAHLPGAVPGMEKLSLAEVVATADRLQEVVMLVGARSIVIVAVVLLAPGRSLVADRATRLTSAAAGAM